MQIMRYLGYGLSVFLLLVRVQAAGNRDRYGGWTQIHGTRSGFFHTEQVEGVWWLITPDGNAFISKGVNNVSYGGDQSPALGYAPYGRSVTEKFSSPQAWAEETAKRLQGWDFNTVGAWSTPIMHQQRIPYTPVLNLAANAGANWLKGEVADVFSPEFSKAVHEQAKRLCESHATDPYLLGYFSDNELRWGADWRSKKSLFQEFLGLPPERPGKQVIAQLLRKQFSSLESLNLACGTEAHSWDDVVKLTTLPATNQVVKDLDRQFLREYARAYFKTCRDAIRKGDPNHLVLGCRFAGYAPDQVVETMGEFVDLVSFNNYGNLPPKEQLEKLHRVTGRPIILTEFAFKAKDSGLPNTKGAGKPVPTQTDRADGFEKYVTALEELPFMVGYHWFEYEDEPAEGRFDGENSNYGLVNIKDEPWQTLVERMTAVNGRIEEIHRQAGTRR